MKNYIALLEKVYEINDLQKAAALLSWDRETNMPPKGGPIRNTQLATLSRLSHEMFTAVEMGDLIAEAATEIEAAGHEYDSTEASLIRTLQRSYAEARLIPSDFVRRQSEISGAAWQAWGKARAEADFASFQPHLEKVVGLGQELADLYGYEDEKYDALLDKFERGMKTADVRAIFAQVKEETVPLIAAISEKTDSVDASFLHRPYDVATQKALAPYFAQSVGYDLERGHIGEVIHPFATSFSRDDARITTRYYPDFLNPFLFGTLHESGHAMYEQGTGPELARTPLARGTSAGIHESQSRLFENLVGRSRGYWQRHFAHLQAAFPEALGEVDTEQFYRAINKVQPSFIRVEADELTYNMHIILRFELEQALINGDLAVADLPTAWNDKMQALLGVVPPSDKEGCLQDVHWTRPMFGYFPTYALGGLYAVQLLDAAQAQEPAITAELQNGEVTTLLTWLRTNIHQHGRKYDPPELIQRATGQTLTPAPFVRYATAKFGEIYGL